MSKEEEMRARGLVRCIDCANSGPVYEYCRGWHSASCKFRDEYTEKTNKRGIKIRQYPFRGQSGLGHWRRCDRFKALYM